MLILSSVCVLNGGAVAGVTCFSVDPRRGLQHGDGLRAFGAASNETTPPSGPAWSSSEVIFKPDSSAVLAVKKGNAGPPLTPGFVVDYPVARGAVSRRGSFNYISDISTDFGGVFVSNNDLFIVDPSYGASILDTSSAAHITEVAHTVVAGQKAMCWSAYSPALSTAYGIDAGQPVVYTFAASTGALTGSIPADNSTLGLFDSAVSGQYMYSLPATDGVVVLDVVARKQIQFLDLTGFGVRKGYMGMAVWP